MPNKIRVVLADDHPKFRERVVATLAAGPEFEIVGEGISADDALKITVELLPDIVLLDLIMPGGGGVSAARRIAAACPVVKIAVLTLSEHDDGVSAAFRAGARGFIPIGTGGSDLIKIMRNIHQGHSYVSPDLAARLLVEMRTDSANGFIRDPLSELTVREEQILRHVSHGLSNKEIGGELNLQEKTVRHYMTNILQKLQVRNRVEAALTEHDRLTC